MAAAEAKSNRTLQDSRLCSGENMRLGIWRGRAGFVLQGLHLVEEDTINTTAVGQGGWDSEQSNMYREPAVVVISQAKISGGLFTIVQLTVLVLLCSVSAPARERTKTPHAIFMQLPASTRMAVRFKIQQSTRHHPKEHRSHACVCLETLHVRTQVFNEHPMISRRSRYRRSVPWRLSALLHPTSFVLGGGGGVTSSLCCLKRNKIENGSSQRVYPKKTNIKYLYSLLSVLCTQAVPQAFIYYYLLCK